MGPAWTLSSSRAGAPRRHEAKGEAVLFSFSDRAIQEKLGLWREEREPFGEEGT